MMAEMPIGSQKQGSGAPVPAFPSPKDAWRAPGALYWELTASEPGTPQAPFGAGISGRGHRKF